MTAPAVPIHTGQDFYVPAFEVRLSGGRALGAEVVRDIISVSYKDDLATIDSFELTINNWDAETRGFKYVDTDLFDPGTQLELAMGYRGGTDGLQVMITGEITSLRPTFPAGGQPTLAVSGLNLLHRFRSKQVFAAYENRTDSEIARDITDTLGVRLRTDPTAEASEERIEYLYQDQYPVLFLLARARRIGYDLFVEETADGPGLYFGPSTRMTRPTYALDYGRSLISFQPELSTANQVRTVTVKGWDATRKQAITASAKRSELATTGLGAAGNQAFEDAVATREEIITDRPVHTETEAKTLALQTLERIAKELVTGTGAVVGLPQLRAGSVLQLGGLGERFSGRYFVTTTTHAIGDAGYTTQFGCRREEVD
jgi:Bacteriophage probable baseplate hub protein